MTALNPLHTPGVGAHWLSLEHVAEYLQVGPSAVSRLIRGCYHG